MKKVFLLVAICTSGLLLNAQKQITLDDIFRTGVFQTNSVRNIRWMNDGSYFTALENNNVVKYDVTSGEAVENILVGDNLNPQIQLSSYEFSSDESKLLLMTERESIYRRSFKANYYIFEIGSGKLTPLSGGGKQSYATFSPDGSMVAFTRENNLFFTDLESMDETQITNDGKFNHIINGSSDWVYEEELSFAKAFFWSPDGQRIAFYKFDESRVKTYNMQKWNKGQLYPEDYTFKYPKAGEQNSLVDIYIYDLKNKSKVKCDIGEETDIYIARVDWTLDPGVLSLRRLNRLQNQLDILHVNATDGTSKVILTERDKRYVDLDYCDDLTYLKDGKHFVHSSEKSGFKHLYLYNVDGNLVRQITTGDYEVTSFLGIDESKKNKQVLYYVAAKSSPLDRALYKIDIQGKKEVALTPESGTSQINMSSDFKYYVRTYSNPTMVPSTDLYAISKNRLVKNLASNDDHKKAFEDYGLKAREYFSFTNSSSTSLNGYMIKPSDFDPSRKYPVLMFQYSGPGSQQVRNSWGTGREFWHQMLAQKGYIIAVVDPRGTGLRGQEFKKMTYGQLGKYESDDQIDAAKYLGSLEYVDKSRIGIWGWSYGGYMSSLSLFKGADLFKMAIAVAPVTNWRFYDTIYTERYMGLPQDNGSGYDDNSPTGHVKNLKGKFLLIHGTGDDNVHFQNSVTLQNMLISEGKQFDSFYYPDRAHGIRSDGATPHIYQLMTNYILENL